MKMPLHDGPHPHLHVITSATSYKPGETVIALLQASSGGVVELQEVELQFTGVERVDTSWVSSAYRKDVAPINADKRHLQRYVVQSRLQAATQGTLEGAKERKFVVRFTLPPTLPPSFRGTAVRVSYHLQALVHFRQTQPSSSTASSPGGSLASFGPSEAASEATQVTQQPKQEIVVATDGIMTSTVQLPIHIWPSKAESEASASLSPTEGTNPPAMVSSDDMPIKCWEIGPGTGVQEAIAHISRLVASSSVVPPSVPASGEGGEGDMGGDSNSEGGEDELPPAAPSRAAALARQTTTESERGPLLSPGVSQQMDPSTVLKSYALRIGEHAIARVSLHPPIDGTLHPGTTLAGTLEIAHATPGEAGAGGDGAEESTGAAEGVPRCMQVLVLLETEERISQRWRAAGKAGAGVIRRVFEEQLDLTADIASTHFIFTVPPDSQANFASPLVALQWVLRFQFTASTQRPGAGAGSNPLQGKIDQLAWALPLHVSAPQ